MAEVNLMQFYPHSKRPIESRGQMVTDEDKAIARQFGKDYFDGSRMHGYGGYSYHPRFWTDTVRHFKDYYHLPDNASILDVGCGKGFMLHDFKLLMPDATVAGIDISEYAYKNAMDDIKPVMKIGNAKELPYPNNSFDLVTAINTVHNLPLDECKQAIQEIQRVSRAHAFLVVDAWRTEEEREKLYKWVVTCMSAMHIDGWKKLFEEVAYIGDYYWFIAE